MDGCGLALVPLLRPQPGGVRVVARLVDPGRGGVEAANGSGCDSDRMSLWFSEDGHAVLSMGLEAKNTWSAEKRVFWLDHCYEEEKGVEQIYELEVRPLVLKLFEGTNCSVFSYGAHQSWPSQLFQGLGGNPSLAEMTMSDILNINGEGIEMSEYEVFQDQIYDLLDPKGKGVQLKGLSKVKVNTVDDFKNYCCQTNRHIRGHRGHIIYASHTRKLNFLDFGACGEPAENKSLNAVMRIVYALNSKNHISLRDSRLTHQLHEFLSRESRSLVVACLSRSNNQQNRRALMLASSSSQVAIQVQLNTIRKPTKQYGTPLERRYSMLVTRKESVYGSVHRNASARCTTKKLDLKKERVQLGAAKSMAKLRVNKDLAKHTQAEKSISEEVMHGELVDSQASESLVPGIQHEQKVDNEESAQSGISNALDCYTQQEDISGAIENQECKAVVEETSSNQILSEDPMSGEEGRTPAKVAETSPKVSDRLREISNSLKFITRSARQIHIGTPKKVSFSACTLEPRTPHELRFNMDDDCALQCADIPQGSLMDRTTGIKKSLKKDCLTYINSATKEDLKRLKGIGEVRANKILQLRDNNPEPFKDVEDLKNIGITPRQFDKMVVSFFDKC